MSVLQLVSWGMNSCISTSTVRTFSASLGGRQWEAMCRFITKTVVAVPTGDGFERPLLETKPSYEADALLEHSHVVLNMGFAKERRNCLRESDFANA